MKKILLYSAMMMLVLSACRKKDKCEITAGFSTTYDSINGKITFTSTSSGDVTAYAWNFGDGTTGSGASVVKAFTKSGTKNVSLTITGSESSCTNTTSRAVSVPLSMIAVEQKKRAVLFDFSETWCPPCGSYGGPSFDSCFMWENSKISLMKVYGSSQPSALNFGAPYNGMSSTFNVSGVPTFFVNEIEMFGGGGVSAQTSYNVNWVKTKADAFAAGTVDAGLNLGMSIVGDTLVAESSVKFFTAQASGDFRLALYVVEDDIIAAQQTGTGQVSNYEHRNLARACNATTYTGVKLNNSAAVTAGQKFNATHKFAIGSSWKKDKLKLIGVIYKMNGSKGTVMNSLTYIQ